MDIARIAHSCFQIKSRGVILVCDPCDKRVGYSVPKLKADIVTISHDHFDHNVREQIKNESAFFIDEPGEYEVKQVRIEGWESYHDAKQGKERGSNTIYIIETADGVVSHLGDLGHLPSDKIVEKLKLTDVLLIPVGGVFTIDAAVAAKLTELIQPTVVVPMHYQEPGLGTEFKELAPVEEFVKKSQYNRVERQDSLSFSSRGEEIDENMIVILSAKALS